MHLVFVYNADAGLFSMLSDYAHKVISPDTYPCSLCALTYGHLGMKRGWKRFVESLDAEVEFLHRDELATQYGVRDAVLPAVFRRVGQVLEPFIDAATLDTATDLEGLIDAVRQRCVASGHPEE